MEYLMQYETLAVSLADGVARIEFNRPDKANALNARMWFELKAACEWLDATPTARVGVLSGRGRHFCAGIDLAMLESLQQQALALPDGHRQAHLRERIRELQACVTALEVCRKPVIAAIHGACVGGGIDLITACDFRYAATDTRFCVKEIDVAIVADVGTLQRLPRIVGEGVAREMAFTAREYSAEEALGLRLVNRVFPDLAALEAAALETARAIASKSPLAVRGTKETLNFSREHSVAEGLDEVAARNAGLLFAPDVAEAIAAQRARRPAVFQN
jgi:enoyl-CoA hydratase